MPRVAHPPLCAPVGGATDSAHKPPAPTDLPVRQTTGRGR